MKLFTIHQAKTHFSQVVKLALQGEEVVVARGKKPLVRIVPLESHAQQRRLGTAKGWVRMSDDFDSPLADFNGYQ